MGAASSQSPKSFEVPETLVASRERLQELSHETEAPDGLVKVLEDHLGLLGEQALELYIHYSVQPLDSADAIQDLRTVLQDAWTDLENHFLLPRSLLRRTDESKWELVLEHLNSELSPMMQSAINEMDQYKIAFDACEKLKSDPGSTGVAELKGATTWVTECRKSLRQALNDYRRALSSVARTGIDKLT
jgi:hypothetical protein